MPFFFKFLALVTVIFNNFSRPKSGFKVDFISQLKNESDFWKIHGILIPSIHDSMNLPKVEFIAYIYNLL